MKVVLASRNKNKIRELETIFAERSSVKTEFLSLDDIGFAGDIEETGSTYEENALLKASVPAALGYIGVADDSGLSVDALDGAPGVYSARFAGVNGSHPTYAENNALLLKTMEPVPDAERGAAFISVIACVLPKGMTADIPAEFLVRTVDGFDSFTVRGECRGVINHAPAGKDGFGYDPLFYVPELGKTFAELTAEEKNAISHRGRAVRAFTDVFAKAFAAADGKKPDKE